jgi:hypothetical protein
MPDIYLKIQSIQRKKNYLPHQVQQGYSHYFLQEDLLFELLLLWG